MEICQSTRKKTLSPEMKTWSHLLLSSLLKYFQPYLSFNEKRHWWTFKGHNLKRKQLEGKHWQERYNFSLLALFGTADCVVFSVSILNCCIAAFVLPFWPRSPGPPHGRDCIINSLPTLLCAAGLLLESRQRVENHGHLSQRRVTSDWEAIKKWLNKL